MSEGYQPKGTGKKPAAPPKAPNKDAKRLPVVMSSAGEATHFVVSKDEAQRVLSWFGQAASVSPEDFELAGRIRRAFE